MTAKKQKQPQRSLGQRLLFVVLGLAALLSSSDVAGMFCGTQAVIGLCLALSNGLPLRGEDAFQWLEEWEAKPMLQFRKAMRNFPAVLRTEYAAALHLGDTARAEQLCACFEAQAKRYPYPGEIEGERELINLSVIPSGCHLS